MSRIGLVSLIGVFAVSAGCAESQGTIGDDASGGSNGVEGAFARRPIGGRRWATGGRSGTGGISATGGISGTGGTPGTGGGSATGGASATGGTSAKGGASGTGGSTATGGSSGAAGASAKGGSSGTAGASAKGGASGTGGSSATGGSSGLTKPALGATVVDPQFGTTIRRITAVSGANQAMVPMYSTISAWNADESLMIVYQVNSGHQLYNGKTYQPIKALNINPPDLEQVYWDTSNPDILYYIDGQQFIRYHVNEETKDVLHDFSGLCGSSWPSNGSDPMFTSWDSHRLGLVCGSKMFVYDNSTDTVLGPVTPTGTPPAQVGPSGTLAYLEAGSGQVYDVSTMKMVRSLTLEVPDNHASLGQLANGHDTWNGAVYDDGNDDAKSNVGILVTWDLTTGTGGAIIGPKTGFPYPPDGHISAMAYRQPGWVFVSTVWVNGNFTGAGTAPTPGLLDLENLVANTNTGAVCRIGRHRSWGKTNRGLTSLDPYWAEPHTVPSPSGTRALFASDWGNGTSVDAYVVELPSYKP